MLLFQDLILKLTKYWSKLGCNILQSYNLEIGAATLHPITFFSTLNVKNFFYAYTQLCKRPNDGDISKNYTLNKLQEYYQFQVIIKPPFNNIQELYLNSLKYVGIDFCSNEINFIESNWENPTLGAYGIGSEVWINGVEVTQFTYFQQMGSYECFPVVIEIAYGLERLCLHLQNIYNFNDILWNKNKYGTLKYSMINENIEKEKSLYNYYISDIKFLYSCLKLYEKESYRLLKIKNPLFFQSYDFALKMIHYFNLLNSRNYFSVISKQNFILRIRRLFKKIAYFYLIFLKN